MSGTKLVNTVLPITAHDGASALEIVENFRPEIALIDIGLPGMDGFELARRLRSLRIASTKKRLNHNSLQRGVARAAAYAPRYMTAPSSGPSLGAKQDQTAK